jgi:anhydro-N-acetylmuramic acid kinase
LVPGFHAAVFSSSALHRSVLNIGGIANVTYLPTTGICLGFDTGPGNGLLDAWISDQQQLPFDQDGQWAASGAVNTELLTLLMANPFLAMIPPKSTGKEEFTLDWLQKTLLTLPPIGAKNVQRTLVEFTALSICDAIELHCPLTQELYVCGGGVNNKLLWHRLNELLSFPLFTTEKLGVAPQWVEAMAFAWLAKRCLDGLPGNMPSVTGARQAVVLGAIYPAGQYPAN